MFIPKKSIPAKDEVKSPHLLLHGRPATGKSHNVLMTFPNIILADFDNMIPPEVMEKRPPEHIIPFYDKEWIAKNSASFGNQSMPKDAFKWWLNNEAVKMTPEQTLVIDSLSALQDVFHIQMEPLAQGSDNKYFPWNEKGRYLRDVHLLLRNLKCILVMIAHELEPRDEDSGKLTSKFYPFVTGGFKAQIGRSYDNIFHSLVTEDDKTKRPTYMWQIKSDKEYNLRTTIVTDEKFVPASWESFGINRAVGTPQAITTP